MVKNYSKRVYPNRYVYHVSYPCSRDSILEKGIITNAKEMYGNRKAIFAHNASLPDYSWYPFCFDEYFFWEHSAKFDSIEYKFLYFMIKYGYEFWRIDTWKIKNYWYLDNVGMQDFYEGSNYPFMIVTFEDIPPQALKRFIFYGEPSVYRTEGVAHVQGRFRAA